MSKQIKFLSLQKSELEYEVEIRGETPANNVQDLRRQILKQAKSFPPEDILESHLDTSEDLEGVQVSLAKLQGYVQSLQTKYDKNLYSRSENLAHHIYYRLARIQPSTPQDNSALTDLSQKLHGCYGVLASFTVSSATISANGDDQDIMSLPSISVTCDRGVAAELSKLKFDGKSCVRAFIQEVEERMQARDIKFNRVLVYATEIFTGDALHWYRSVRDSVNCWEQLAVLLKRDFSKHDYDYRLMNEIRSRTQGELEPIVIYLAIMDGMFSRLSRKVPEEEKLEVLLHNIRPCYADVLACLPEVTTIAELRAACRNYENHKSRASQFREPPKVTPDTLAPECAYSRPNMAGPHTATRNTGSYGACALETAPVEAISTNKPPAKSYCPRCRVEGHSLRSCKEPRFLICFKCGKKGFRRSNCPDCKAPSDQGPINSKN